MEWIVMAMDYVFNASYVKYLPCNDV